MTGILPLLLSLIGLVQLPALATMGILPQLLLFPREWRPTVLLSLAFVFLPKNDSCRDAYHCDKLDQRRIPL